MMMMTPSTSMYSANFSNSARKLTWKELTMPYKSTFMQCKH